MGSLHRCLEEKRYSQFTFLAKYQSKTVNARDKDGLTPLHVCCQLDDEACAVKCVRMLLSLSAEPDLLDRYCRAPFHYACKDGKYSVAKTLLKLAPDISVSSPDVDGNTPLHYAAAAGNERLVALIIKQHTKYGLDVDKKNNIGFAALHVASADGLLGTARELVRDGGASVTQRDDVFFKTAYEWLSIYYEENINLGTKSFDFENCIRRNWDEIERLMTKLKSAASPNLARDDIVARFCARKSEISLNLSATREVIGNMSTNSSKTSGQLRKFVPQPASEPMNHTMEVSTKAENEVGTSWSMLDGMSHMLLQQLSPSYRKSSALQSPPTERKLSDSPGDRTKKNL